MSVLKPQTVHINPTDLIEIPRQDLLYTVRGEGTHTFVEIRLPNWNALRPKLSPRHVVSLDFQRVGHAKWTEELGDLQSALVNSFGVIRTHTAGGFDPSHLSAVLNISDSRRGHIKVATGTMHKPDVDETVHGEEEPSATVTPLRSKRGLQQGLIDIITAENVAGPYELTTRGVATPVLRVNPAFGKALLLTNQDVQMAILPEVFRRIVTDLVLFAEEYDLEPWTGKFKEFAAAYAPSGEWEYYTSGGTEDRSEVSAFVSEGVRNYFAFLQSKRAKGAATPIIEE